MARDPADIQNIIILNNTSEDNDKIVHTYKITEVNSSKFSPGVRYPPQYIDLFVKHGRNREDIWRNFLHVCGQMPWQTMVSKDDLKDKFHFSKKLLTLGSMYIYVDLVLVTKKDICKLVYDKHPTTKEQTIQLLKEEIAFKELCSNYVFDIIEYYPDMENYDMDKYQEIVNTYNEIQ